MPGKHDQEHRRLVESIRASAAYRPDRNKPPEVLSLPFEGTWLAANSPTRRVPSHGTHFLGQTFAIDFVKVNERRRSGLHRDWRTFLGTEPPDRFRGYEAPILAPATGRVVRAHDGEVDHEARRSILTLVPYLLTQGRRLREGLDSLIGNHVILELRPGGPFVLMAHLRRGSLLVRADEQVEVGQQLARCGNSGNSTQPHVHIQVMGSPDLLETRGRLMAFRDYLAWPNRSGPPRNVAFGVPGERERIEPV